MKKLLFMSLLFVGCQHHHTDSYQAVPPLNIPQEITLTGPITSDIIVINDPRMAVGYDFSGSVDTIVMPHFLDAYGTNVYFHVEPTANRLIIWNGQKAGASKYTLTFYI